jgi:DNA-binding MarR family transcriptional regulator
MQSFGLDCDNCLNYSKIEMPIFIFTLLYTGEINMNLNQVESFLSIVRLGTISKAAKHLRVTQSAISQRLHSLEKEYDVSLLIREQGVRNVTLTNDGVEFYQIALEYESLVSEARKISERYLCKVKL